MNKQFNNMIFFSRMVAPFLYIAIGLAFLFNPNAIGNFIPPQYAPILGIILLLYGLFRGYRAFVVDRKS